MYLKHVRTSSLIKFMMAGDFSIRSLALSTLTRY